MKLSGQCLLVMTAATLAATSVPAADFVNQGSVPVAAQPTFYAHSVAYGNNLIEVRMVTLPDGKDFSTLVNGKVVNHLFVQSGSDAGATSQSQYGSYIEASAKSISDAGANARDFNLLMSQGAASAAPVVKFAGLEAFIKADHAHDDQKPNAKGAAAVLGQ